MLSTTENNKITHEKKLDPPNTHEKKFGTHEIPMRVPWYDATKPTRPTIAHDPQNLVHSC